MKIYKSIFLSLILIVFSANLVMGQWIKKSFPYTDNLIKVRFASDNVGWVLGNKHIYGTTDGGSSWAVQDTVLSFGFGLFALNNTTALYSDFSGRIRRTSDGGATWNTVDSLYYYIYDIKFLDSSMGYAVGGLNNSNDTAVVEKTTNGGASWSTIAKVFLGSGTNPPNYDFESISLVDSQNFWAVTYAGIIFNSTNGGVNWNLNDTIVVADAGQPMRDIQFTTPDSGWVVGGLSGDAVVAHTTDGGAIWTSSILSSSFSDGSIHEVHMIDSHKGWIVSTQNGPSWLAKTTDGGATWQDQTPAAQSSTFDGFQSMSIVNDTVAYVVGDFSNVWKTTTGGVTAVNNDKTGKITHFYLAQNYPNPFNPTTVINYSVPTTSLVTIKVYDVLGREISTLVSEQKTAGSYNVQFNGSSLASGIYFYRMQAGDFVQTKKLVLMK